MMNEIPAPSATAETIRSSSGSARASGGHGGSPHTSRRTSRQAPGPCASGHHTSGSPCRSRGRTVERRVSRCPRGRTHTIGSRPRRSSSSPGSSSGGRTKPTSISPASQLLDVQHRGAEAEARARPRGSEPGRRRRSRRPRRRSATGSGSCRSRPRSPVPVARATAAARSARASNSRASVEQRRPGRRERGAAAVALEQLHTELGLERADLLAHARLRQVQAIGRPAEVQLLGDGDERAQLPELHRRMIGAAFHRRGFSFLIAGWSAP